MILFILVFKKSKKTFPLIESLKKIKNNFRSEILELGSYNITSAT